jgi:hypothetical protein
MHVQAVGQWQFSDTAVSTSNSMLCTDYLPRIAAAASLGSDYLQEQHAMLCIRLKQA